MNQKPGNRNNPFFYSFISAKAFSAFTLETQHSQNLLIFLVFPS